MSFSNFNKPMQKNGKAKRKQALRRRFFCCKSINLKCKFSGPKLGVTQKYFDNNADLIYLNPHK